VNGPAEISGLELRRPVISSGEAGTSWSRFLSSSTELPKLELQDISDLGAEMDKSCASVRGESERAVAKQAKSMAARESSTSLGQHDTSPSTK
jgi:hypothetical protein